MTDNEILDLFFARDERAIAEVGKKYGRYLRHAAGKIVNDPFIAEECENDAYLDAWNSIPPARPEPLQIYLAALARRRALDRLDEKNAAKRGGQFASAYEELSECLTDETEIGVEEQAVLRETIASFLRKLKRRERAVFLQRYWHNCSISEIAADLRMSESAVKMMLLRTREKLKNELK